MALLSAKNGTKHREKQKARAAGFHAGGIATGNPQLLVEAGKIHPLVHTGNLLSVAVEHLGFYTVWIE